MLFFQTNIVPNRKRKAPVQSKLYLATNQGGGGSCFKENTEQILS